MKKCQVPWGGDFFDSHCTWQLLVATLLTPMVCLHSICILFMYHRYRPTMLLYCHGNTSIIVSTVYL